MFPARLCQIKTTLRNIDKEIPSSHHRHKFWAFFLQLRLLGSNIIEIARTVIVLTSTLPARNTLWVAEWLVCLWKSGKPPYECPAPVDSIQSLVACSLEPWYPEWFYTNQIWPTWSVTNLALRSFRWLFGSVCRFLKWIDSKLVWMQVSNQEQNRIAMASGLLVLNLIPTSRSS